MEFIPYGRQSISKEDVESVVEALQSDFLTQGPRIGEFETACASYCGSQFAVAVNSATSALHCACLALRLGKGDILWTSPNTYVASANCALYCGAEVDFVDIDSRTYNISIDSLRKKLLWAKENNKLPKILVAVHFAGQSCDMKAIKELANEYGFRIIEDASHAIGGSYKGKKIGSCEYSDIVVFSFHPVKIITTGEGGMAVTNSEENFKKLMLFRSHGVTRDEELMEGASHGPWYYQQIALGFNYRITDIQASLGVSQLQRIDDFIVRRHELFEQYNDALKNLPINLPYQDKEGSSAFHLYPIQLKLSEINSSRKKVFESLRNANIGVNVHYIPVHTQPFYKKLGFKNGDFPQSENYYAQAISIPLHYSLTDDEQNYVIKTIKEILSQ